MIVYTVNNLNQFGGRFHPHKILTLHLSHTNQGLRLNHLNGLTQTTSFLFKAANENQSISPSQLKAPNVYESKPVNLSNRFGIILQSYIENGKDMFFRILIFHPPFTLVWVLPPFSLRNPHIHDHAKILTLPILL